jgi:hypothetical protein
MGKQQRLTIERHAFNGNIRSVRRSVRRHMGSNGTHEWYARAAAAAAMGGQLGIVKYVDKIVTTTCHDSTFVEACVIECMQQACYHGHNHVACWALQQLLRRQPQLQEDDLLDACLLNSCLGGNIEFVWHALRHRTFDTPLLTDCMCAAALGDDVDLLMLLAPHGGGHGAALCTAARSGASQCCQALLDRGDLAQRDKSLALVAAASEGQSHMCELLMDGGAAVTLAALVSARCEEHTGVVEVLNTVRVIRVAGTPPLDDRPTSDPDRVVSHTPCS